jgi:LmbE family N-acetylglucosaminyl deacetylase
MSEHVLTLMAVHAHPDDEATGTGGVLARYAAEGLRTVLVTCTDGSCGDGPGGVKPGQPGHDPAQVVAAREVELKASCAALGVSDLELLGYADSGMMGWPQNEAPGAFWSTPVPEAAQRLAGLIEKYQPDVIVTYDENGFYGHPDHIQAHRITMAALPSAGARVVAGDGGSAKPKVYWTTVPRSALARFGELAQEAGMGEAADQGSGDPGAGEGSGGEPANADELPDFANMGLPDDEISTWVDVRAYSDQKYDALAAHASQSDNIMFLRLGRERFKDVMGVETFSRVDAGAVPGAREDDLFAGLR